MLFAPKTHGKNGIVSKFPPGAAPAGVEVGLRVGYLMKLA
jgi:hypothetical protein